jgi:hypothetical protein
MRKSLATLLIGVSSLLGATFAHVSPVVAATRVITAKLPVAWVSNGQSSDEDTHTPLIVGDLSIGDVIDVQISGGNPHGFVTVKQLVKPPADNEARELVLACGEDKTKKPNAVMREIECGATSHFGIDFKGSLKLEILDTFKDDVNFWCVIHLDGMTGTLKLKPKA